MRRLALAMRVIEQECGQLFECALRPAGAGLTERNRRVHSTLLRNAREQRAVGGASLGSAE